MSRYRREEERLFTKREWVRYKHHPAERTKFLNNALSTLKAFCYSKNSEGLYVQVEGIGVDLNISEKDHLNKLAKKYKKLSETYGEEGVVSWGAAVSSPKPYQIGQYRY